MSRGQQLVRAWVVASGASLLGAVAHLLAGGLLPSPIILLLVTSLSALITLGLGRLQLARTSLAAGVLLGQGLLHLLYSQGGHGTYLPLSKQQTGHHLGHGATSYGQAADFTGSASQQADGLMLLGHLLVAALTFALLAYGEESYRLLTRLLAASCRALLSQLPRILPWRPAIYRPQIIHLARIKPALLALTSPTRGPPALLA